MSDIVFMDTETLGLDLDAPIWEFAAIRRNSETGVENELHLLIEHDLGPWFDALPEEFQLDYLARFKDDRAVSRDEAAEQIRDFLADRPHIIGAVPSFDTARISHQLMRPNGFADPWHYHLIDIENVIVGWIRGHHAFAGSDTPILPPYKSDELSETVGVDPEQFTRHTAMGDVLWVRAQWDHVMGVTA